MGILRTLAALLAGALLLIPQVPAQAQTAYTPAQLEALAAPIALYPDAVVSSIIAASMHPADVIAAARAPGGDDPGWDPSVRALEAFPELLERMADDPRWLADFGAAAYRQAFELSQAVQALRQRAYAGGTLANSDQLQVGISAGTILIQPSIPQVVYLPYYDPLVAYAPWRPLHPTAQWRPWPTRRVFLGEHRKHERREAQRNPNGPPSPAAKMQAAQPQIGTRGNGPPSPAQQLQEQQFQQRQQQQPR
jgi:hypothetical protein